jgi:hypothetical protein
LGFAVVDAAGAPARRARLFARWLVAGLLPALWSSAFLFTAFNAGPIDGFFLITGLLALVAWSVVLLAVAIVRPTRGLHDQLTGCWLVPR